MICRKKIKMSVVIKVVFTDPPQTQNILLSDSEISSESLRMKNFTEKTKANN